MKDSNSPFAFFGSSRLSVIVLDELQKAGYVPSLIITTPDKPQGRKLALTSNIVKEWAIAHSIPFLTPLKLDADLAAKLAQPAGGERFASFIVASYGKIIPESIINLPPRKSLNIHPSLLPLYRGPSPLPTAMLDDAKDTGVSIMVMDKEMDHGPIIAQQEIHVDEWPTYEDFEEMMAREGARLLASILPDWIAGKISEKEQEHAKATYTKKYIKEDGLLELGDLSQDAPKDRAYAAFRKIQAFHQWPQAFFFIEKDGKKLRIKITSASFKEGKLIIEKVIPEGGREMSYDDFKRGYV